MNKVAVLACSLFFFSTCAMAQVPKVLGTWELDLQASDLPRVSGYFRNAQLRSARGWGHPDFIQVVSKTDGKDYPQYQSSPPAELQISGTTTPFTYSETANTPSMSLGRSMAA